LDRRGIYGTLPEDLFKAVSTPPPAALVSPFTIGPDGKLIVTPPKVN
jgi:hypothetical protein